MIDERRTFSAYYKDAAIRPRAAFHGIVQDPKGMLFGFFAVLISATLYTLVYVFLIFGGGQPFKPLLPIPLEEYYRYNVFFCAPSMFLGWMLASGLVHLLSRPFSSSGTFTQTMSVLGFGISIASWTTGIHDLTTSFLGAVRIIDQHEYEIALNTPTVWRTLLWIQMTAYLVWFLFLFSLGVKTVYGFNWGKAFLAGLFAFVVYQGFFLIFNR